MSASEPSQRPLKRRCTDVEQENTLPQSNPTFITRSNTLWFDDGTIILEVQNMQFRVHKTFLSANSVMFNDMFKIPQPESEALVEGCAIVRMNDEVEDWENLLNAMYFPMKIQPLGKDLSTRHLISMLRLGKKYQFDNIYNAGLMRLKAELPSTLAGFLEVFGAQHVLRDCSLSGFQGRCRPLICATWSLFDLINVAVELDIKSVLPTAFLLCLARKQEVILNGSPRPDGTIATLSQNPFLLRILLSRDQIRANSLKYSLDWLFGVRVVPAHGCEDLWQCYDSCIRLIKSVDASSSSFLSYSFLCPTSFQFDVFCDHCIEAKNEYSTQLSGMWNQLPSCFGFPKWEDLLKADPPS